MVAMIKVFPKDDRTRKLLAHPVAGKFRAEGPATWPDDAFTARRIEDGSVTLTEVVAPKSEPPKAELPKRRTPEQMT